MLSGQPNMKSMTNCLLSDLILMCERLEEEYFWWIRVKGLGLWHGWV